ncbi:MAG: hypothetical protein IID37_09930 [Planctomycetes bacterium]|nr:hypothetical protein [Planctomycetota bacterium]
MVALIQKLLLDLIESSAGTEAACEVGPWAEVRDPFVTNVPLASVVAARE